MLVFRGFSRPAPAPTVLTIGNFDGVHLGHRALLRKLKDHAAATGLMPAVLTFEPHPREFFAPDKAPTRLSSLREKLELIAAEGIDFACIGRFNAALASMDAEAFVERLLVDALRVGHLIVGDDFRYGAGRRGDFALLETLGRRHGFTVEALGGVQQDGLRLSSSAVRHALADGRMEDAARFLGRPYVIDGRVVRGQQLGRHLGVPTANIRVKHRRPALGGVYAVSVDGLPDGPHRGIANIGYRPSVDNTTRALLEVHLFDLDRDLYGAHLSVRFLHKIRDERKFADLDALKHQISEDLLSARQYFTH
ncbi:bifunctional riboflavin kinase/FAD synthetase [Propionivibrio dicarboxylicus]|uniref:Riboflavin biosynthesis protein n=1 Tax=Propionivibrio dicarboxylicus TaxID=83767 RepID=A0A1G7ZP37_9RHOO|nr:bifunctional riboflavin kinase/FAD synthetase [Propionivibrio dicarboxylicus]SDH09850.1 riboflavin kinase / FMN adenylyltransferase [Propionivibrio dicarboxylicus]